MSFSNIYNGAADNDGTGLPLRDAFTLVNSNFVAAQGSIDSLIAEDLAIRGDIGYMDGTLRDLIGGGGATDPTKVNIIGDTMTGTLRVPNVFMETEDALISGGTLNVDFEGAACLTVEPSADFYLTGQNVMRGSTISVRFLHDASDRALTYDSRFTFVGTAPTTLTADATSVLTLTAFGTDYTDIVGAFAESV